MTARICVVGSTNVDLLLRLPRHPVPGETVLARSRARHAGGKGANQAVALARLGAQVRFVSAVGSDDDGTWSLSALREEGVPTDEVAVVDAPTGLAVVSVDDAGENTIVVAAGANLLVTAPSTLTEDALLLSLEVPLAVVSTSARVAREQGVLVVLNAAPWQPLPPALLADIDVLVMNATEAAQQGSELAVPGLVVTLGGDGAQVVQGGITILVPAPAVEVVDTTGAGDCFAAALTFALASGRDLVSAASWACRAASRSVQHLGARTGSPSMTELELMDQDDPMTEGHAGGRPCC